MSNIETGLLRDSLIELDRVKKVFDPNYLGGEKDQIEVEEKIERLRPTVEFVLKDDSLRRKICAALHSVSDDVFEIATEVLKVVVPIVALGQLQHVPANELTLALFAIVIGRMGVSALCANF